MSKFDSMTDVEYFAAEDEFMDKYNAPKCKPIEVLDLICVGSLLKRYLAEKRKWKFVNALIITTTDLLTRMLMHG